MKTVEIIGYNRANLGKSESKRLREQSYVPAVLYGGKEQITFYSPMILFRDVVYTDQVCFVDLNIEGLKTRAILQDIQFHPVSEVILHADFLMLHPDKPIKMNIPLIPVGTAPGVKAGGKLIQKIKTVTVKALPDAMPSAIEVDVNELTIGKIIKIGDLKASKYEITNSPLVSIFSVEVPRAMKGKTGEGEEGAEAPAAAE